MSSLKMSAKGDRIAEFARQFAGRGMDPRYAGYFECFDRGEYYEAHDVLEHLWLPLRREPAGDFYKALIQLAGAFVHFTKGRRMPGIALLRLSRGYLARFEGFHESLDVFAVLALIAEWERAATEAIAEAWFARRAAPKLRPLLRAHGSVQ